MKKPNVIWFIVDQMRGQATGCNGDPNVFTPNLDNMAIGGTNFPDAVSGYPLCCPFRGSMLTGKYAHNHSVKLHEDRLDPSLDTVTDVFRQNDYETVYLGKWHLAGFKESEGRSALRTVPPEGRGRFDTWLGYDNNNSQWDCYLHGHDGDEEVPHYRLPGYETDCLTDMALGRIAARSESDRPFFMVVSVQPPHTPGLAPAEHRHYQAQQLTLRPNVPGTCGAQARIALSSYYAQIENIDANVGRLVDGLRNADLLDDTHIMFFCDHGDQMGSQGRFGKCVPYEESVRVPFLIGGGLPMRYDGRKSGNAPCLVNHVDIAPTTLGLCGLDVPDWMEGFDYSHRRTGRNFQERMKQEPQSAYLQLIGDRESSYAWRCVVTRDGWKYACVKDGEWMLYNLNSDPYEQNNLAFHTGYRQKREELKALLQQWIAKTGDDFPVPMP
ncbi:MAG: sulfatase-like hydrolase/transferase [Lentisphaerae bacterium]|nr:sulfatase-like hydrolase/transferase [Lentisphaerota bacterium]MBT4820480.1 sulfatase-like hydrolase/transferase [Lentisphaerota bacterium]MBT5612485.1 sulfatase-like hydrolase/transferase [Lentisphaerota bacterium]MBT7061912.1 sulfatase-like hydrolase/transferase [Lentisphaerota bacterium]MBT7845980.1 sulfatase-like hydrolase/transferase [Lentisphaerota bacterium]